MVFVPTLTMLSPLLFVEVIADVAFAVSFLLTGARVLVEMCDVTFEPSALVVVTATVVGMDVLDGACWLLAVVVPSSEVVVPFVVVPFVVVSATVLEGVESSAVVLEGVGSSAVVLDGVGSSAVVLDGVGSGVVVTPVPTTCRFGITPSGIFDPSMVAKSKRKENIIAANLDSRRTI
jgi:hypothetical protein